MRSALISAILVVGLSACGIDRKDTEKAAEEVAKEVQKLKQSVTDYVQTAEAPEELQKLLQWEYQLVSFPVEMPANELQAQLNELGKARWDCFHVERLTEANGEARLAVLCKRRPDSALKYLPRHFVGNG